MSKVRYEGSCNVCMSSGGSTSTLFFPVGGCITVPTLQYVYYLTCLIIVPRFKVVCLGNSTKGILYYFTLLYFTLRSTVE